MPGVFFSLLHRSREKCLDLVVFGGMGRPLRYIPPGSLVEITTRTLQERFLLAPASPLPEITLGVLGRAQRLTGVEVHAFTFLSNHYHLLVTVQDAHQLARFAGFLNSNLAREAGRLNGWRQKFWADRYRAIVVTSEPEAQEARLAYLMRQGCKEGLVADPEEWPGARGFCDPRAPHLRGIWIDRTAASRAGRRSADVSAFAREEWVRLTPLPCWKDLAADEQGSRLSSFADDVRAEALALVRTSGRTPLGAQAACEQNPFEAPEHSSKRRAPWVHASSTTSREQFRRAYAQFVAAFRQAALALRRGAYEVAEASFPLGCFRPPPPFRTA